jgi:hypothetical protein
MSFIWNSYASGSVFTVTVVPDTAERHHRVQAGTSDMKSNEPSFDLAVVQLKDDGTYLRPPQMDAADDCIRKARTSKLNTNGAVVIVFIHGWHHGASWKRTPSTTASDPDGDDHFHAFRLVLESLALREAERYSDDGKEAGRRVVGIYVAWNGDPEASWISGIPVLTHGTFWNRYAVAEKIGGSMQFQESIRKIVNSTKGPITDSEEQLSAFRPESPLVIIGHSMGALMLQSAFAALLEDQHQPLQRQRPQRSAGAVEIRSDGVLVSFPDIVLSLNSAADSAIAKRILKALNHRGMTKKAAAGGICYSPPLLMSVTSTGDTDTRDVWSIGKLGRKTDGNDSSLFTHALALDAHVVTCNPRGTLDLGQNWHCLRRPQPPVAATPAIPIDLPVRERNGRDDLAVPHTRYTITPKGSIDESHLMWVFQVPTEVIKDHNDIFNSRARSLVLALIQVSGAVASIAESWEKSFEP